MDAEQIEKLRHLRKSGDSLRLIAQKTGVSLTTVRRHACDIVVKTQAERGPRGRRRQEDMSGPLPLSADFAYFLGVFAGDGSLTALPRTYQLRIACHSAQQELTAKHLALLTRVTGRMPAVRLRRDCNGMDIVLYGMNLPVLLGLPCGRKQTNGFIIPPWVFEMRESARGFVRGLIETDGGIYKRARPDKGRTWECILTAHNPEIMNAFLRATEF